MVRVTDGKNYEESEREILNIASELFYTVGYTKTSMQNIADKAGITKAALYYYFDSKETILFEVYNRGLTKIYTRLIGDTQTSDFESIITKTITVIFEEMVNCPIDFRLLSQFDDFVKSNYAEVVNEKRKKIFDFIKDAVEKYMDKGVIRKDLDSLTISLHIFGSINWMYYYHPDRKRDIQKLVKDMTKLICSGTKISS